LAGDALFLGTSVGIPVLFGICAVVSYLKKRKSPSVPGILGLAFGLMGLASALVYLSGFALFKAMGWNP
jgi:hypothetical protein